MNKPTERESSAVVPKDLVAAFHSARRIVVLTGAGMSAESGIPTFRDALTGQWSRFDPQQLATEAGFRRDPALVWGWYEARRRSVLRTAPNAGHVALRDLASLSWIKALTIVTQNVDDLHERSGSKGVVHLHGSLFAPRCIACDRAFAQEITAGEEATAQEADGTAPALRCPHCHDLIRPGVVWFGEELPTVEWQLSVERVEEADLLLIVGTSGRVYPAASLPDMAERKGCPVWVIDPNDGLAAIGRRKLWRSTAASALPSLYTVLA